MATFFFLSNNLAARPTTTHNVPKASGMYGFNPLGVYNVGDVIVVVSLVVSVPLIICKY